MDVSLCGRPPSTSPRFPGGPQSSTCTNKAAARRGELLALGGLPSASSARPALAQPPNMPPPTPVSQVRIMRPEGSGLLQAPQSISSLWLKTT